MHERHLNREIYFEEQAYTTEKYVIPFIEEVKKIENGFQVLEIGCAEAGNLKPFLDRGCVCTGVDLSSKHIKNGYLFYSGHPRKDNLHLFEQDIYQWETEAKFDVIIMKDVIEHIHDQDRFMAFVKRFLKADGAFFLGFPPWQNPFGGHQQMCTNKKLSLLPYFHLLPQKWYARVLKLGGEKDGTINGLLEIKETGITIERFLRIIKKHSYRVKRMEYYFINPNYEVKFGLRPRKQFFHFIPGFRNFITTACYFVIANEDEKHI